MDLVTVAKFYDLPSAQVALSAVRAAGIEAYLQGEYFAQMNVWAIGFQGGLRLNVFEADEAAALEIVAPERETNPEALKWGGHPQALTGLPVAALATLAGDAGLGYARLDRPVPTVRKVGLVVVTVFTLAVVAMGLSTCITG